MASKKVIDIAKAKNVPEFSVSDYVAANIDFKPDTTIFPKKIQLRGGTVTVNGDVKIRFFGLNNHLRAAMSLAPDNKVERAERNVAGPIIFLIDPTYGDQYYKAPEHAHLAENAQAVAIEIMISLILNAVKAGAVLTLEGERNTTDIKNTGN